VGPRADQNGGVTRNIPASVLGAVPSYEQWFHYHTDSL
jgi:hypothetical protein